MGILKSLKNAALAAIIAAGISGPATEARADPRPTLHPEARVFHDLSSDSRAKLTAGGLEAAVEHVTDSDYNTHQTQFGVKTPELKGFELRQTGVVDYGTDVETSGGFNTNVFFHVPKHNLRFGAGGGSELPSRHWVAHGNVMNDGELLKVIGDLLYDSNLGRMDGRGYASVLHKGLYLSIGKPKGTEIVSTLGYIGGPGRFNLMNQNWVEPKNGNSNHNLLLMWNSTKDRGYYEFHNRIWTGPDGCWELLNGAYDPTIGWAPMLAHHGEYSLQLTFKQDDAGLGGGALFAYNPGNRNTFLELGGEYRHNFDAEDSALVKANVGASMGQLYAIAGGTADVKKQDFGLFVHFGRKFEL